MLVLVLLLSGAIAGLIAGLFGVGGGLVLVPIFIMLFTHLQMPITEVTQLAVATSMACIVFTAISSIWAHQQKQAIIWSRVLKLSPAFAMGTALGVWFSLQLLSQWLQLFIALFALAVALSMLNKQRNSQNERVMSRQISPKNRIIDPAFGLLAGAISAIVGIGGGTLTVPYFLRTQLTMPNAVACAAACGFPIALFASLYYMLATESQQPQTIGYIYWPAVIAVVPASMLLAPLGAQLAHKLNAKRLQQGFALLLIAVSCKMAHNFVISFY